MMISNVSLRSAAPIKAEPSPGSTPGGGGFGQKLGELLERSGVSGLHKELQSLQAAATSGKSFTPQELFQYQMKAGQFGLRLELISRLGESVSSTVRKFQQQG